MVSTLLEEEVIQSSLPVRLFENPYGLVSLREVLEIFAHRIIELINRLRDLEAKVCDWEARNLGEQNQMMSYFGEYLIEIDELCKAMKLRSARKQVQYILKSMPFDGPMFVELLQQFRRRVNEDMEDQIHLCIPSEEADAYRSPFAGWEEIVARFNECSDDVEEMNKCFALGRYTAAVFHALLVVEHGLIELGERIGVADPKLGWDPTYKKLDALIKDRQSIPSGLTFNFLEQSKARLDSMKLAWRNKVNHAAGRLVIERSGFRDFSAEEVISACRSFMRYLVEEMPNENHAR